MLKLPDADISEARLLGHLREGGIAVDGISSFYHRPRESPLGLAIGYATPPEHAYADALDRLIDGLCEWLSRA